MTWILCPPPPQTPINTGRKESKQTGRRKRAAGLLMKSWDICLRTLQSVWIPSSKVFLVADFIGLLKYKLGILLGAGRHHSQMFTFCISQKNIKLFLTTVLILCTFSSKPLGALLSSQLRCKYIFVSSEHSEHWILFVLLFDCHK